MRPKAFISFQMEDKWARDHLAEQTRKEINQLEFVDYPVSDPVDSFWKIKCRDLIASSRFTIVLVGPTTFRSDAVAWEIAETKKQDHPLVGVRIHPDQEYPLPLGLDGRDVLPFDFNLISHVVKEWT